MGLVDALLLDAYRMNIWVAVRTDGVVGTGTQNDPYDGSTAAKFDGLMNALPISPISITSSGTTATVTALNHGYGTGNLVLVAGATNSNLYNGTFNITVVDVNTFTYTMTGSFTGTAQGNLSCRITTANGPSIPVGLNPPFAIRLGPGVFQTGGYCDTLISEKGQASTLHHVS